MINTWVGDEALGRLNNETDRENYKAGEFEAIADIEEQLGIKPVRSMYELKGMEFDGYEVDIKAKTARMFYFYNNSIITILMRQDERGIAKGSIKDGDIKEVFEVNTDIGIIEVAGMESINGEKYMAEFIANNTYYHIFGEVPKEEFTNLLKSIFF